MTGPIHEAFELAARLGYDGVELHLQNPNQIDREEAKRLSIQHKIEIPALGTGMAAREEGLTFTHPDRDVRQKAVDRIKEQIGLAQYLNSAVIIGSVNGKLGTAIQQSSSRRAQALACLAECCDAACSVAITILLEPLNRYESDYINTVEQALDIIKQIGSPNIKLLADTFHMNIEEVDIMASLRQAGSHLGHVHLVDSNREVPGHGHLHIQEVLRALQDLDYKGYLSFEVLPSPDPKQAAEDGIRFVKSVLSSFSA
jgi:sugar phosphate isomerase/epimerase